MSSNFAGTRALGGLVAVTLFCDACKPYFTSILLISLEDSFSNEKVLKEPKIKIVEEKQER